MTKLKGLATGIGSLPHKDVDSALDLIFKYVPRIPFWPQLPKRDIYEGMIVQYSEGLPCLRTRPDGLIFESKNREEELEIFYDRLIAEDIAHFKISETFALGLHKFYQRLEKINLKDIEFIKCQVTGPFTFAASINDDSGRALLYDEIFKQAILKGLMMKALWQINFFKKFGKKIILFFDEPYLACLGSGYAPINREDIIKGLSELTEAVKSEDVLLGIHCCGNTDWSVFTEIKTIDIISFDAFAFLDRLLLYADNLREFFRRDGILCWGIVPTSQFTGTETVLFLTKKIKSGIDTLIKKGLDKNLLLDNLLISPSCGLGTLDLDKAKQIFKLLSDTSTSIIEEINYLTK